MSIKVIVMPDFAQIQVILQTKYVCSALYNHFDSSIEMVDCAYDLIGGKEEEDCNLDINLSPGREEL